MKVTVLPEATREHMLDGAGLDGSARWSELDTDGVDPATAQDLGGDGWHTVEIGAEFDGGVTSHRGVLAPEDVVDSGVFGAMVEDALGFTYAEVSAAYREGRPSNTALQLRAQIDARLLELSVAGGNMLELAKALGWTIKPASGNGGESCPKMERALARARREA